MWPATTWWPSASGRRRCGERSGGDALLALRADASWCYHTHASLGRQPSSGGFIPPVSSSAQSHALLCCHVTWSHAARHPSSPRGVEAAAWKRAARASAAAPLWTTPPPVPTWSRTAASAAAAARPPPRTLPTPPTSPSAWTATAARWRCCCCCTRCRACRWAWPAASPSCCKSEAARTPTRVRCAEKRHNAAAARMHPHGCTSGRMTCRARGLAWRVARSAARR